jgi:hypothetical protein
MIFLELLCLKTRTEKISALDCFVQGRQCHGLLRMFIKINHTKQILTEPSEFTAIKDPMERFVR